MRNRWFNLGDLLSVNFYKKLRRFGAQGRNRTGMVLPPRDFKSLASTCFATWAFLLIWRLRPESNRRPRLCRPLHNHSATQPTDTCNARIICICCSKKKTTVSSLYFGAGNETRTRDPNLGKVVLYQLSYSRVSTGLHSTGFSDPVNKKFNFFSIILARLYRGK